MRTHNNHIKKKLSDINEAVYDLNLEQNISLGSACGTPLYTNYTNGFTECLDYIFYETTNIDVEQVNIVLRTDPSRIVTPIPQSKQQRPTNTPSYDTWAVPVVF